MAEIKTVENWKQDVKPVLESKVDEFKAMGYAHTSEEDIWNCLLEKVWKGNLEKRLHEVVQDIFHLGSNVYLSYLTVKTYKNDDIMASIAALTGEKKE